MYVSVSFSFHAHSSYLRKGLSFITKQVFCNIIDQFPLFSLRHAHCAHPGKVFPFPLSYGNVFPPGFLYRLKKGASFLRQGELSQSMNYCGSRIVVPALRVFSIACSLDGACLWQFNLGEPQRCGLLLLVRSLSSHVQALSPGGCKAPLVYYILI